MSVVKSKRGEGQLLVITKANELATYNLVNKMYEYYQELWR